VRPGCEAAFAARFDHATRLGAPASQLTFHRAGAVLLEQPVETLRTAWDSALPTRLG